MFTETALNVDTDLTVERTFEDNKFGDVAAAEAYDALGGILEALEKSDLPKPRSGYDRTPSA